MSRINDVLNGLHCAPCTALVYSTTSSITECIQRITAKPHQFKCELGTALWYECEPISDRRLIITFSGGQFRRTRRTCYRADLISVSKVTYISLHFESELLSMPPMTPASEIDLFMKQKVDAVRCD